MNRVILSLGSNIGEREDNLKKAIKGLQESGLIIHKVSSFYETEPWGYTEQGRFINAVLMAETSLEPQGLLRLIKSIEAQLGREVTFKWGPRIIDIDIIFYGDEVIDNEDLKIPHPLLHKRDFVLKPLVEILPYMEHPTLGMDVVKLRQQLKGDRCYGKDD